MKLSKKFASAILIIVILFLSVLLTGCSHVSEEEAEQTALLFLHDRVKFYSTEGNKTLDVPEYKMNVIDSYKQDRAWHFTVIVSSTLGDETKTIKKGDAYHALPNVPHGGKTQSQRVMILDVFHPPRKDYMK